MHDRYAFLWPVRSVQSVHFLNRLERSLVTPQDFPYRMLVNLTEQPAVSQRDLAERLGVSLGKVNFCVRALVDKGLIKVNNFRRSDNKRAYVYVLTPAGVEAKSHLATEFLRLKLKEFDSLQREIEAIQRGTA